MCLAENLCFNGENEVEVVCDEESGHTDDHIDNERGFSWPKEGGAASFGTSGGVELTDEVVEQLADEAEQGYEPDQFKPRRRK